MTADALVIIRVIGILPGLDGFARKVGPVQKTVDIQGFDHVLHTTDAAAGGKQLAVMGAVHERQDLPVRCQLTVRDLFPVIITQQQHKVVRRYAAADFMLPQAPKNNLAIPGEELVPVMIAEDVVDVFEIRKIRVYDGKFFRDGI